MAPEDSLFPLRPLLPGEADHPDGQPRNQQGAKNMHQEAPPVIQRQKPGQGPGRIHGYQDHQHLIQQHFPEETSHGKAAHPLQHIQPGRQAAAGHPYGHPVDALGGSPQLKAQPGQRHVEQLQAAYKNLIIPDIARGQHGGDHGIRDGFHHQVHHYQADKEYGVRRHRIGPQPQVDQEFGVEKAMMTTVHSYTGSQRLLDAPAKDLREARSAAENIVPTTTGASKAAALTIPSLQGKFNGLSVRVPTPVVSLSDITALIKRNTTKEELTEFFKKIAKEPYYEGIIGITEEELVSSDFIGDPHSCIVDLPLLDVVDGNMIKVVAWYDNEWGYSNRLVELTVDYGKES